jgi:hypothetical protein
MTNFNTEQPSCQYTSRAPLVALGLKLTELDLFGPVTRQVVIAQKTVKHQPTDKLYDGLIAILAGAHGLVEINKLVRSDPVLQKAFGRTSCAEQSVVQETLNACTAENVVQMHRAVLEIYQKYSRGYSHDYLREWQLLDVDMTGQPCGKKAALATKGYFAKTRNRRGRQLGRVLAYWYEEVVVDRLFAGTTQLHKALIPLLKATEQVLGLSKNKRRRTIVRVDSGGGSLADLNWLLSRGYCIMAKDCSGQRAGRLARSVLQWYDDPLNEGRQVGLVEVASSEYSRPVKRIAVRCPKKNGQWATAVLITNLAEWPIRDLTAGPGKLGDQPGATLLAYAYFYDQRGGGVETSFKQDKQGLGLTKRNKKKFEAQAMLTQLNALAHNVLIWLRDALAETAPQFADYGLKRMVRDLLSLSGLVHYDVPGHISRIIFNQLDPFATPLATAWATLLTQLQVDVNLGQT